MSTAAAGLDDSPEIALIAEALASARTRIDCFRIAFGAAGQAQRMTQAEFGRLISDLGQGGRSRIVAETEGDLSRGTVKMLLLALMCLETAMPWGAQITIRQTGRAWRLRAIGDRARADPLLWAWLDGGAEELPEPDPSTVHFALLGLELARAGRKADWSVEETGANISF